MDVVGSDAGSPVGMGLAPIRFPENSVSGVIALAGPDGGKPHPYSSGEFSRPHLLLILDQREDIVALQLLAPLQERQLDQEGDARDMAAKLLHQFYRR